MNFNAHYVWTNGWLFLSRTPYNKGPNGLHRSTDFEVEDETLEPEDAAEVLGLSRVIVRKLANEV